VLGDHDAAVRLFAPFVRGPHGPWNPGRTDT
jgi:hypothetical protein